MRVKHPFIIFFANIKMAPFVHCLFLAGGLSAVNISSYMALRAWAFLPDDVGPLPAYPPAMVVSRPRGYLVEPRSDEVGFEVRHFQFGIFWDFHSIAALCARFLDKQDVGPLCGIDP